MTQEQKTIWDYLCKNCVGIKNAQHVADIAQACGFNSYGTNNDDVRSIVTDMVINKKQPIGSCSKGYFLITSEEERQTAINWVNRNKKVDTLKDITLYQP